MSMKTFFSNLLWRDNQPTVELSCNYKKELMYDDESNFAAYSVVRMHKITIHPPESVDEVSATCNVLFKKNGDGWAQDGTKQRVVKWDGGNGSVSLKSNIETSIPLIEESWVETHQRNQENVINSKGAHIVFDNSLVNQDLVFAVDIFSADKSVGKRVWISKKGSEVSLNKERPTDLPAISADEKESLKAIKPKKVLRCRNAWALIVVLLGVIFIVIERANALFDFWRNIKGL